MGAGFLHAQPGPRRRRAAVPAAAIAATALLCGCGHSASAKTAATHRHLTVACTSAALEAMARTLTLGTANVATAGSTGGNAMPQCTFSARLRGKRVEVTMNVDNGPQPYFVLERTIVEASQIFPQRLSPPPQPVDGLGLEAAWFPAATHLEATDGKRLLTATVVTWPGAATKSEIQLARAMIAPYLKTPHGKAAQAIAKGYPSS